MFLALHDLRRGMRRFALVAVVVALVATLSTVLAGLADGLVRDGTSGLRRLPATHLAFAPHSGGVFSRSVLGPDAIQTWVEQPGIDASPLGMSFVNAASTNGGPSLDLALFGVAPDSFLLPNAEARKAMAGEPGLVLAEELRDEGVKVGDRYRVAGSDFDLPVLGFTFAGSYGHVPIAYVPLATWQELTYGSDARDRVSAIALRNLGDTNIAGVDTNAGTETITKQAAYAGSPGFSAETATMTLIRGFLLVIAAMIIGAFFTVLTVQRTRQIGLLKALGASTWYVLRDGVGQMTLLVVVATAIGTAAGAAVVAVLQGGPVPVELTASTVLTSAVALVVAGVLGSLVSMRRIARVEPVVALGTEI
ncbi:MAG: ABC transporter permease [Acidimicrobiales bacterium]